VNANYTPTLQKSEGFRVKASEGEVVVLYFEPSATQNLKASGFPAGQTTWQNRPHPSNSPMEVSKNFSCCYDIGNNCGPLSILCHVVYATKGYTLLYQLRWFLFIEIMNCPAAPNGGIAASLGQATGYQSEYFYRPRGGELNLYPPLAGLSAGGGLN